MAYHEEDWAARMLENWAKWAGDGVGYARITTNPDERMPDEGPRFPTIGSDAEKTDRALRAMDVVSANVLLQYHQAKVPQDILVKIRFKRRHLHNRRHQAHHDFRAAWLAIDIDANARRAAYKALQESRNPSTGAAFSPFR